MPYAPEVGPHIQRMQCHGPNCRRCMQRRRCKTAHQIHTQRFAASPQLLYAELTESDQHTWSSAVYCKMGAPREFSQRPLEPCASRLESATTWSSRRLMMQHISNVTGEVDFTLRAFAQCKTHLPYFEAIHAPFGPISRQRLPGFSCTFMFCTTLRAPGSGRPSAFTEVVDCRQRCYEHISPNVLHVRLLVGRTSLVMRHRRLEFDAPMPGYLKLRS